MLFFFLFFHKTSKNKLKQPNNQPKITTGTFVMEKSLPMVILHVIQLFILLSYRYIFFQ